MISQILLLHPYWTIAFTAFLVNIPLGYIRENTPKFSLSWLFWIHASIPLIIYLRISLHINPWFIPVGILLAIGGQILGSRLRKKRMNVADKEKLEQIPRDLITPGIFPSVKDEEVLVALLNMGGPKTNEDVPDFQRRLFNDTQLIRFPLSSLFQSFFAWALVTFRGKASQERYQLIGGGSPIFESTQKQVACLREELKKRGRNFDVTFSFNYSPPLPEETIAEAKRLNKKYIFPVSLYPHYSAATTGSNVHYLKKAAQKDFPELKFLPLPDYHLHPSYINGFVDRIYQQLKPGESLDDFYLIFSAHGLPLYNLTEGDPYAFQISQTTANILSKLNRDHNWTIGYQSAVGPLQWLKPSIESLLEALARRGIKKLMIVPLSFVSDHIETLCEIDIEYRKVAADLGIEDFRMTRALETHLGFIKALADAVESILPNPRPNIMDAAKQIVSQIIK